MPRMPYLVLLATAITAAASAQQPSTQPSSPPSTPAAPPAAAAPEETVLVTDVVKGMGDEAFPGMVVIVHYTGWLYDAAAPDHHGRKFDSSRDRGQPLSFPLGSGRVIRGWEQGVPGMKVGGKRSLVIPPSLAYGSRGAGNGVIPPNATLIFDVELLAVETVTHQPGP
ncbi:MAG TPA: FKBP-type peptidyl-prolyl cis-trans isomerase [Steroidobacteraceae bacterium]|nr:FKBP-type peptidyl-prolyl cis-trans isomerase [Steroidobacteraceae bacterium]